MDHEVEGPAELKVTSEATEDIGRTTVITRLQPGETLTIVKYLAYGWSARRSQPALHDQVRAALAAARFTGWDGPAGRAARATSTTFWATADVEIDGDAELQQAVRLAMFHVLQAGARAERARDRRQGPHRRRLRRPHVLGHRDVLPARPLVPRPEAAADALRWRQSILPLAYERAEQLGLAGAAFPWRTIRGQECSGYWPAGTAAFHINADIADAVRRHVAATGDDRVRARGRAGAAGGHGAAVALAGPPRSPGQFRIDGVTGPDEYTAIVDNNVYTNLMAQLNLRVAADTAAGHGGPRRARRQRGGDGQLARRGRHRSIPYDERLGVHPQAEGFTQHQDWDFEHADGAVPAAAARARTSTSTASRCQAGRPGAGDAGCGRRVHPRADGPQLRLLRGDHGARLVAVGVHAGGDRGLGRPPRPGLRLPGRGCPGRSQRPGGQLRPRRCTSRRWPAPGRPSSSGSVACATTTGLRVRAAAAAGAVADVVRAEVAGPTAAGQDRHEEAEYGLVGGPPMRLRHFGEQVALADAPAVRAIPAPDYVEPVEQPYGRAPAPATRVADGVPLVRS